MPSEQDMALKIAFAEGQKAQRLECETLRREKRTLEARIVELERQIAALSWAEITPENLPKVGDEILLESQRYPGIYAVGPISKMDEQAWASKEYKIIGANYRRPINPPLPSGAKGETKP